MKILDDLTLSDIDPEDVGDTLYKLQKSFGIEFQNNSFEKAATFGDICEIIQSYLNLTDNEDCTKQQAFYKVRNAIALTKQINPTCIEPSSKLEDIFPRKNRRKDIRNFKQLINIPVDILVMKTRLLGTLVIGFMVSFIYFFFNREYAVSGIAFFILLSWVLSKFSKEFEIPSVKELAEKITREHYSKARKSNGTTNRKEIVGIIQDVFIADHLLDREYLTPDARLSWAKDIPIDFS